MPYNHMNSQDWFWAVPAMIAWIAVFGTIIYVAVRLVNEHSHHHRP